MGSQSSHSAGWTCASWGFHSCRIRMMLPGTARSGSSAGSRSLGRSQRLGSDMQVGPDSHFSSSRHSLQFQFTWRQRQGFL